MVACYAYTPAPTAPAPGARLALDLNDLGRYQLGEHVGPGVARIDGWLVSFSDSQYTLRVERTIGLTGATVTWNGEQVSVSTGYVGLVREKRFSPGRTIVLAGAVTAGFVAFIATRSLTGTGGGDMTGPPGGGGTSGN